MDNWFITVTHWLSHLIHWNHGKSVTKIDDEGNLWAAFECDGCGKIQNPVIVQRRKPPMRW
jgi:hypothetical protein